MFEDFFTKIILRGMAQFYDQKKKKIKAKGQRLILVKFWFLLTVKYSPENYAN